MSNVRRRRPTSVGMASLFAVLVVLCLVVFTVLSRITASSELALTQKAADSITAYYEAEYRATQRIVTVTEDGEFTEDIDEHRELSVKYEIVEGKTIITEWAIIRKGTGETTNQGFGDIPIF